MSRSLQIAFIAALLLNMAAVGYAASLALRAPALHAPLWALR